jgi:hypothetical protein
MLFMVKKKITFITGPPVLMSETRDLTRGWENPGPGWRGEVPEQWTAHVFYVSMLKYGMGRKSGREESLGRGGVPWGKGKKPIKTIRHLWGNPDLPSITGKSSDSSSSIRDGARGGREKMAVSVTRLWGRRLHSKGEPPLFFLISILQFSRKVRFKIQR